jgi:hypothetical protein
MKKTSSCAPEAATGQKSVGSETASSRRFGDKREVADLAGMRSIRWVDAQLEAGMPCLKLGLRRVRFDLEEVREWLKSRYHQQRHGPAQATSTKTNTRKTQPKGV